MFATWLACGGLPTSCRRPGHFSLLAQRKVTKRKGTPSRTGWATPNQSVRGGRAFRQGILPWRKGMGIPAHSPCGALSTTPHRRRQGFEELTGSCRCAAHRLGPRRCARGLQAALLNGCREHRPLTPIHSPQGRGAENGFASWLAARQRCIAISRQCPCDAMRSERFKPSAPRRVAKRLEIPAVSHGTSFAS